MQSSQTIQKLAFEGPLSLRQLIVLGLVAAAITGFLTYRECKASGSRKPFAILFPARFGALMFLLWMLAGATLTTLLREVKPSSVLLLVDSSASMGLVDPIDGSGNAANWCVAQKNYPGLGIVDGLQRVIGELRSAQSAVRRLQRRNLSEESSQPLQALWEQLSK